MFQGSIVAMVTPMFADGAIDDESLARRHFRRVARAARGDDLARPDCDLRPLHLLEPILTYGDH